MPLQFFSFKANKNKITIIYCNSGGKYE